MTQNPFSRISRTLVALGLVGSLASCAAISAVSDATTPLDVYELRAPSSIQASARRSLQRDVIVELPTTGGSLDTDRIMIRPDALQAQYLPDVRWSEPTPVMVQTLMLRTIEATGAVRYVARKPLGAGGDFAIVTEVVDFQAETMDDEEGATVRIRLIVRVVRESDARIIASRTFDTTAEATSTETQVLAETFNTASDAVFTEFASWLTGILRG